MMTALTILLIAFCIMVAPHFITFFLFGLNAMLNAWDCIVHRNDKEDS